MTAHHSDSRDPHGPSDVPILATLRYQERPSAPELRELPGDLTRVNDVPKVLIQILPYILLARPFFAGQVQLGTLMQTAGAFGQVQTSLSYFVNAYTRLAEWTSVVDRLSGFELQFALTEAAASKSSIGARSISRDASCRRLCRIATTR